VSLDPPARDTLLQEFLDAARLIDREPGGVGVVTRERVIERELRDQVLEHRIAKPAGSTGSAEERSHGNSERGHGQRRQQDGQGQAASGAASLRSAAERSAQMSVTVSHRGIGGYSPLVLPPDLADFAFRRDETAIAALAARAAACRGNGRVLVLGASVPALLTALRARDAPLVVLDSSRAALRRVSSLAAEDVELLADDPREFDAPGGITVALATATAWRSMIHDADRQRVLRSLCEAVGAAGTVVIELERVPEAAQGRSAALLWNRQGDLVDVRARHSDLPLLLTAAPVADLAAEVSAACGAAVRTLPSADAPRVHVVAGSTA